MKEKIKIMFMLAAAECALKESKEQLLQEILWVVLGGVGITYGVIFNITIALVLFGIIIGVHLFNSIGWVRECVKVSKSIKELKKLLNK